MDLFRVFYLQCARRLPGLPDNHPCARLHGHSFTVKITLRGPLDPALGWVMDFGEVGSAWQRVYARLDHRYLNDIAGLENPTSENLAIWLWQALLIDLPQLYTISVMEGHDAGCIYYGSTQPSISRNVPTASKGKHA